MAVDAKAQAAAITNANIPGMVVSANATTVPAGTSLAAGTVAGTATYTINGIAIAISGATGGGALSSNRANAVAAINAQSAATGVVASDTGSGVSLTAADGRNVAVSYAPGGFTTSAAADFGLPAASTTWSAAPQHQLLGADRHQRQRRFHPDRRPQQLDGDRQHRHRRQRDGHLDRRRRQCGADRDRRGAGRR